MLLNFHEIRNNKRYHLIGQKIEIAELCKGVHYVDPGESFQTHIYLQNLASIQPRTSPLKFAVRHIPTMVCLADEEESTCASARRGARETSRRKVLTL